MSNLKDFKCPNCGGALEFDSASQKLKCPHCDGSFDIESFNEAKDFTIENDVWENEEGLVVYTCKSCGGTIMADKETAATSCPYCGNPVVMTSNVSGDYKPSRVIPFKFDKKTAKEQYKKHLSGKVLLPNAFKTQATIDEIKGIYVPFWLFDGKAQARMWFDARKTRVWQDSDYTYTETSIFKLFRSGSVDFSDVPVDASSKIDDDLTQSIEPFKSEDLKEYNDNYLAGYFADKYDVDAETCKNTANSRIANSTSAMFASTTTGYEMVTPSASQIYVSEGKQEYVLFPVWLLNVNYGGKKYTFAMNGQTGKFVGDLPADKGKLMSILLMTFIGVFILVCALQFFLG